MDEQAGALDVAQELRAKSLAEVRAFNQSGYVGDDEGFFIGHFAHGHDSEVGLEGSERVVGDFGASGGDARDERGLAGVWEADEANIGEQFEFEAVGALLAGAAQLVFARSLVRAGGKVLVAASATAAFGNDDLLIWVLEIVDELAGLLIVEAGADGDLEDDGAAVLPGAVGAHAVFAPLRLVLGIVAEVNQRVVALR